MTFVLQHTEVVVVFFKGKLKEMTIPSSRKMISSPFCTMSGSTTLNWVPGSTRAKISNLTVIAWNESRDKNMTRQFESLRSTQVLSTSAISWEMMFIELLIGRMA